MTSRRLAFVALVIVVSAASAARLTRLGTQELWFDELLHTFAAKSLAETGAPTLPSGRPYQRAMEITRLVSIARQHIASPELAARVPSAVLGIANVIIFAAIAWRIGGPWVAVWAALLLGVFPGAVLEARNSRFYTEQLDLGLVAFWFGWLAIRPDARAAAASYGAVWGMMAGCAIAFGAAGWVQLTTGSVALAWLLALAITAAFDVRALGRYAFRLSPRVQAVGLGIVAVIAVGVLRPEVFGSVVEVARYVPSWAAGQYSPRAYYWMLSEWVPVLLALSPVIFLFVLRQSLRLGLFLVSWFGLPLVLHSLAFPFQASRYVLLAMPALLLAAAMAAARACGMGFDGVRSFLEDRGVRADRAALLASVAVLGAATFATVTSRPFSLTRKQAIGAEGRTRSDWRAAAAALARVPGSDTIPWGTGNPLASLFYWPRTDFVINNGSIERLASGDSASRGSREAYGGLPVMTSAEDVRAHFGHKGAVLIAVDSAFFAAGRQMPVLRAMRGEATEVCDRECGPMRVFYWPLTDPR